MGQNRASRPHRGCGQPVGALRRELVSREIWSLITFGGVLGVFAIEVHISRTRRRGQAQSPRCQHHHLTTYHQPHSTLTVDLGSLNTACRDLKPVTTRQLIRAAGAALSGGGRFVASSRWVHGSGRVGWAVLGVPDLTVVPVSSFDSLVAAGYYGNRGLLLRARI